MESLYKLYGAVQLFCKCVNEENFYARKVARDVFEIVEGEWQEMAEAVRREGERGLRGPATMIHEEIVNALTSRAFDVELPNTSLHYELPFRRSIKVLDIDALKSLKTLGYSPVYSIKMERLVFYKRRWNVARIEADTYGFSVRLDWVSYADLLNILANEGLLDAVKELVRRAAERARRLTEKAERAVSLAPQV